MTSYTGRHRVASTGNPTRTTAKVVLAGAAFGAAGFALSPAANAASDSDWDRLAQCDAGGNWGIDTGNGFQGGLQFTPQTWQAYGGGEYAATANGASREQQMVVAERVLAGQGWGAWPSCSAQLGLNSAPTDRSAPGAQQAPAVGPSMSDSAKPVTAEDYVKQLSEAAKARGIDLPIDSTYAANKDAVDKAYADNQSQVDELVSQLPR